MRTSVNFPSNGLRLAGILFTPDNRTGERLPAVVVSHPGGGVKEQTASIYAQRLADKGYAALVFDAAYQGESEGEPRFLEDPFQRSEDVKSAVTFLTTRDDIDPPASVPSASARPAAMCPSRRRPITASRPWPPSAASTSATT
ncbi:alpha/beta hydrolase [Nocardia gamkensis]|uniref:alpha/beta hydrolase n=1 Tax=Nocardia gamkensis TaxID=352869 RepID=UPI0037C81E0B